MKLNLGGGLNKIDDFLTVDLCDGADIKHDLLNPLPIEDNSVDEIVAIHIIESFCKWQLPEILKDWYRVLNPGGKMIVEFTDLDATINLYLNGSQNEKKFGRWGFHGEQGHEEDPITYHRYVYTTAEVEELLKQTGFIDIKVTKEGIRHHVKRDNRTICGKAWN